VQPDPPLSGAARDVTHELEAFALRHPDAKATVIAWHLACVWVPGRLRRKYRSDLKRGERQVAPDACS
jgi:hypothetical protein